ncbi:hypothetical protein CRG98_042150 [Punica granatum]|uniref:Uncharacterized protein n=1 Tax=Punica granatum TaxID=22663 RepID=A0A2I0I0T8_PUNGR|nr:hypothetical protein CRG98_042150 [Punica granatum]
MVAQFDPSHHPQQPVEHPPLDDRRTAEDAKSLIHALGLVSRNLPLPPDLVDAVSAIYSDAAAAIGGSTGVEGGGGGSEERPLVDKGLVEHRKPGLDLLAEFEDALTREWPNCKSGHNLAESREKRLQSQVQHRISELEGQ